jgi:Asp/Glu/hydantoin racemase
MMPEVRLVNIVDEGYIGQVIRDGRVTVASAKRLLYHYFAAEEAGADFIFTTCSSIGDATEAARSFVRIPIVRIDEAMALSAVGGWKRIAVLATLSTTLGPTMNYVEMLAKREGREIAMVNGLASGAFEALSGGDPAGHNRIIMETAAKVADRADVFLLAQASMAAMAEELASATGKPVLSSLLSGMERLRSIVMAAR